MNTDNNLNRKETPVSYVGVLLKDCEIKHTITTNTEGNEGKDERKTKEKWSSIASFITNLTCVLGTLHVLPRESVINGLLCRDAQNEAVDKTGN